LFPLITGQPKLNRLHINPPSRSKIERWRKRRKLIRPPTTDFIRRIGGCDGGVKNKRLGTSSEERRE